MCSRVDDGVEGAAPQRGCARTKAGICFLKSHLFLNPSVPEGTSAPTSSTHVDSPRPPRDAMLGMLAQSAPRAAMQLAVVGCFGALIWSPSRSLDVCLDIGCPCPWMKALGHGTRPQDMGPTSWARSQSQNARWPGPWHTRFLGLGPGPIAHDAAPMSYGLVLCPEALSYGPMSHGPVLCPMVVPNFKITM